MASQAGCAFCRIVRGELPAGIVDSSDAAVAFLDVAPLAPGHLLVVPRDHFGRLDEMPADRLAALIAALPRLAAALVRVTDAEGYNLLQNNGAAAGQVVEHVHFHLIPRRQGDGLGFRWHASQYQGDAAEEMLERYRQALAI